MRLQRDMGWRARFDMCLSLAVVREHLLLTELYWKPWPEIKNLDYPQLKIRLLIIKSGEEKSSHRHLYSLISLLYRRVSAAQPGRSNPAFTPAAPPFSSRASPNSWRNAGITLFPYSYWY